MKTQLITPTVFLLLFSIVFFTCKKPEPEKREPEKPIKYPIEISFEEYSLEGTECEWINLPYDNKIIVITQKEDFENFIQCVGVGYPEIDFEKKTLLLISGINPTGIYKVLPKKMMQLNAHNYQLDVTVSLDDKSAKKEWSCAITVNKLHYESIVELNLTTLAYNVQKLWTQPLEVIQATVVGNWKITFVKLGGPAWPYYPSNKFADITANSFFMFSIEEGHIVPDVEPFSYTWDFKQVNQYCSAVGDNYVMQSNEDGTIEDRYFFMGIINDELYVWRYEPPCHYTTDVHLHYRFLRISE